MVEIRSIQGTPVRKRGEIQGTELPAIIQEIIHSKADELKALIGTNTSTFTKLLTFLAQETLKARENPDAYLIKYLHDKLDNGEELTEEEFNLVFEKEEREEVLSDKDRVKLLKLKNLFVQFNKERLQEYNFSGANLSGVSLQYADLEGVNLQGAILESANLRDADLKEANLAGANLAGANLAGANLYHSYLKAANLAGANLRKADLYIAYLQGTNLNNADLRGTDLRGSNLQEANLAGAILQGTNLKWTNLKGARNLSEVIGVPASLPESYKFVRGSEYNYIVKV